MGARGDRRRGARRGRRRPGPPQGRHRPRPQRRAAATTGPTWSRAAAGSGRGRAQRRRRLVALRLRRRARTTRRCAAAAGALRARPSRRSSGPGCDPEVRHLANSAATLTSPGAHFDLVRPRLAVYGLSPVPDLGSPPGFGLRRRCPRGPARPGQAGAGRAGRLLRPHVHHRARHHARPGPAGVRRRDPAAARATSARCWWPAGADASPAGSAWTSSSSTSATTPRAAGRRGRALRAGARRGADRPGLGRGAGTIDYEIVTRIGRRVPRSYVVGDEREPLAPSGPRAPGSALGLGRRVGAAAAAGMAAEPAGRARPRRRRPDAAAASDDAPDEAAAVHADDGCRCTSRSTSRDRGRPPVRGDRRRRPRRVLPRLRAEPGSSWRFQRRGPARPATAWCSGTSAATAGRARARRATHHRPARPDLAACSTRPRPRAGGAGRALDGRHDGDGARGEHPRALRERVVGAALIATSAGGLADRSRGLAAARSSKVEHSAAAGRRGCSRWHPHGAGRPRPPGGSDVEDFIVDALLASPRRCRRARPATWAT